MGTSNESILIKGIDKTKDVLSWKPLGHKIEIIFKNNSKRYLYNRNDVKIIKSALANPLIEHRFLYLKEISAYTGLFTEDGINILERQYKYIDFLHEKAILSTYLTGTYDSTTNPPHTLIFPFGFNISQKTAVEQAWKHSMSVIQGPPGTGKTQTILNILANAIMAGKSVAVVSNNNTATANIQEKLRKYGVEFVSAYLGNARNKQEFIQTQTEHPLPQDIDLWAISPHQKEQIFSKLRSLSEQLNQMLKLQNELAELQQKQRNLRTEYQHFCQYYDQQETHVVLTLKATLRSFDLLYLAIQYERICSNTEFPSFWNKLYLWFKYGLKWTILSKIPAKDIIDALQKKYYLQQEAEWQQKIDKLTNILKNYDFNKKMSEYSDLSMQLLKSQLGHKYTQKQRPIYQLDELWKNSQQFLKDYPVILSTTYSLRTSLSHQVIYDYVIIDESSQVDLATGALALSCARKAVIVGDSKQLPNVVNQVTQQKTDEIFKKYNLPLAYRYSNHSILQSVLELFPDIPQTILREHYRCHPKIISFCNEKFYNGQLIIHSQEKQTRAPLVLYKTVPGNHAREHLNQRQIDVIKTEVLPQEHLLNTTASIGIVTPYRQQTEALKKEFNTLGIQADTVDKFQGREKDVIILSTVDNQISDFADQPNRLNVAISRAKQQLIVVTNGNFNNKNGNLQELISYIEYNNLKSVHSQVHSVFDYLYEQYASIREQILKHNKISQYDSENLMYQLIKHILKTPEFSTYQCLTHIPLRSLIKDFSILMQEEIKYAKHPNTHIDFLIFNKLSKQPLLAIEVDGFHYHKKGTRQFERDSLKNAILKKCGLQVLRLETIGSKEKEKILSSLKCLNERR